MTSGEGARTARSPTVASAARICTLVARYGTPLMLVDCGRRAGADAH